MTRLENLIFVHNLFMFCVRNLTNFVIYERLAAIVFTIVTTLLEIVTAVLSWID